MQRYELTIIPVYATTCTSLCEIVTRIGLHGKILLSLVRLEAFAAMCTSNARLRQLIAGIEIADLSHVTRHPEKLPAIKSCMMIPMQPLLAARSLDLDIDLDADDKTVAQYLQFVDCRTVDNLTIYFGHVSTGNEARIQLLLRCCATIERLDLQTHADQYHHNMRETTFPKLEYIRICDSLRPLQSGVVLHLLSNSLNLVELVFWDVTLSETDSLTVLRACGPRLTSLGIYGYNDEDKDIWDNTHVAENANLLRNLTEIKLRLDAFPKQALHMLMSLRHIEFDYTDIEELDGLAEALADLEWLPTLRKVTLYREPSPQRNQAERKLRPLRTARKVALRKKDY